MTYCVGVLLDEGMLFASDSRTNAGLDNVLTFCKMTVFERPGDRVIVLLSSGNLAATQTIVSMLKQASDNGATGSLWSARTMLDVVLRISDVMRAVDARDGKYLERNDLTFNASLLVGGQIRGEAMRLFRIYAETNFIEATRETPFLQTGEVKYGKPIIDRVITPSTSLADAAKCLLVSFDSTMRSNISVGMPIDLLSYERDALAVTRRRRFERHDPYFDALSRAWSEGTREVFAKLPTLHWQ